MLIMTLVLISGLFLLVTFLFLVFGRSKKSNGLPPGPRGLPLLGNIGQIVKNPHLKFSQWTQEYGKLYTIKMGTLDCLVVSDTKLMKEIFGHPASTGKFKTEPLLELSRGPYGILNSEGQQWQELRHFCMRSLARHGFGKNTSMEPLILSEIQEVVDYLKEESRNGKAVALVDTFHHAILNVLWTIVTGERISLQDHTVSKLFGEIFSAIHYSVKTGLMFLSWLKYVAPKWSGYNELVRVAIEVDAFIRKYFKEHRKTYTPGAPRDVIDSYLEQIDKQADNPKSTFYGEIGIKNSVSSIVEIFAAGAETNAYTMNWLVLYLCRHPDVQTKVHEEIDRIVGNREPSLNDRPNLPYTEAVIQETLRKSSVVFFGAMHELLDDIDMFGYKLPKGLLLIANLYYVHHNKEIWGDPENFRPERFLIKEGSEMKLIKNENIIPFQVGKRECLGEPLAKDMLLLFVTKLLQTFQFLPDPDNPTLNMEPDVGIFLIPQPFKVSMRVRCSN